MFSKDKAIPYLSLLLGGIFLSLASPNYYSSNQPTEEQKRAYDHFDREPAPLVTYTDERDRDIHERANRRGNWNYKQNWRYDRKAFYKGDTQQEAYDDEHPEGVGGIGMDPDYEYLQMRQYYIDQEKNLSQPANQGANNNGRMNGNSRGNDQWQNGYQGRL